MAGTTAPGQLVSAAQERHPPAPVAQRAVFSFATPAHDADLRGLLRSAVIPGEIRLTMEREPSFFAASPLEGPAHDTLIGTDPASGKLLCAGCISTRARHVNGRPTRVGYLSALRLSPELTRPGASLLRAGYAHFHHWHTNWADHARLYLTSIAADNTRARRFLEYNLPGLPTYRYLDDLVTLLVPVLPRTELNHPACRARTKLRRLGLTLRRARRADLPDLATFLNRHASRYQFSPYWSPADFDTPSLNLNPSDFRLALDRTGAIVGCAALWDQTPLKQIVVRGYSPRLARLRPLFNLFFRATNRPTLPPTGTAIRHAYASHVAAVDPDVHVQLVDALQAPAYQRRLSYLTCAFAAKDPRLPVVRRRYENARTYTTRLYAVHWPEDRPAYDALDANLPVAPEVATL